MEKKRVRTRFAPSPTGYLHVGSARTALFCWLFARHHGGDFILRIEDTDLERSTDESIQAILDGMEWLDLDYDEGPYYQTKRFDRYKQVIQELIDKGHAYRCYCTKERLSELREEQEKNKQKPRYNGHCRHLNHPIENQPFVVRFKNPTEGVVVIDDLIRGEIKVANSELDDLIIARTDSVPTYNLTVVVDDYDMKITHVIRGDDHINNTPRQINILKAMGADLPHYAHLPMILGGDGKRLSKRHGAVSVMQYRDDGYLPEALLNYLVRLGWSYGDQEIFTREEMIKHFSLNSISGSPARFDHEKLNWVNQQYLKTLDPSVIANALAEQFALLQVSLAEGPTLEAVVSCQSERCKTLKEMAERSRFFYEEFETIEESLIKKNFTPDVMEALKLVYQRFSDLSSWNKEKLHEVILGVAETSGVKLGKLAQPIRIAVTGGTVSPSIDITLELIGRDRVLSRLEKVIA